MPKPVLLFAACAAMCCACVLPVAGQPQTASGSSVATFAAGSYPISSLLQASDGNLYGVTYSGGVYGAGSVYQIGQTGTVTTFYSFTNLADGGYPAAGVVEGPDGALYGTTTLGGTNGLGTVFRITSTTGLTTLYSFDPNLDGNSPYGALTLASDGNLYGMLAQGAYDSVSGNYDGGTLFRVSTTGSYQDLYSFPEDESLGNLPTGRLVQASDGNFWGTTSSGGANGDGTVFFWSATAGLTVVYDFAQADGTSLYGLVEYGGSIYGVTFPALTGAGEIFAVSLGSHAFSVIYSFTGAEDGGSPASALLAASDGYIYGTTQAGGTYGTGTFFRIGNNGVPVTLYSLPAGSVNTFSDAALQQSMTGDIYLPLLFDSTVGLSPSQMDGAGDVLELELPETAVAPVEFAASASTVALGQNITLTWSLPDAASLTAQQCYATSTPYTPWTGPQAPSGSLTGPLDNLGTFTFALTCGGVNSTVVQVVVVATYPTVTTVTGPTSVVQGQSGTLRVTVQSASSVAAGGTVLFRVDNAIDLATVTLLQGAASFTASTTGVPLGTYTIQGYYSGDATHAASVSPAITVEVINSATTTTTLTATPATAAQGQQVTLSSAVTSNAGTPTGTVTFLYGSYVIGSAALSHGTASLTASTTGVPVGSYGLHASYSGSTSFLASSSPIVTVTVN